MATLDKKLIEIRRIIRNRGKYVMKKLFDDNIRGIIKQNIIPSCFLCGSEENLTKEHVLPRWVFENDAKHFFTTDVNELKRTYSKATLPACSRCNSDLLNSLERYIQETLSHVDLKSRFYSLEEWDHIIRWLEIIDFKFQVYDITSKFIKHERSSYIPFLADTSIAFMRYFSVRKITSQVRLALKRIAIKNKERRTKFLIVAKTRQKSFHCLHSSGDFLFVEIPTYNKAFFYFFERTFKSEKAVLKEAARIITSAYKVDRI